MVAAAPEGSPPRRISNKQFKKKPCPPCLGEALRRDSIVYITIFMGSGANTLFMPVSTEQGKTDIRKRKPCLHPLHFGIRDKPNGFFQEECTALLRAIFVLTLSQVCVIRKLSSIASIIRSNFFIGMARVRISTGTQGRADGSNIPNTARGLSLFCSSRG